MTSYEEKKQKILNIDDKIITLLNASGINEKAKSKFINELYFYNNNLNHDNIDIFRKKKFLLCLTIYTIIKYSDKINKKINKINNKIVNKININRIDDSIKKILLLIDFNNELLYDILKINFKNKKFKKHMKNRFKRVMKELKKLM